MDKIARIFVHTFAATSAILALYFAAYSATVREANIELKVDAAVLAMEVSLLQRSLDGGKKEIAKLNEELTSAGKMCGLRHPVRRRRAL